jgi:thiamine biosynthesis protein ThiI
MKSLGKVVCLVSGGIDSPVAAWMMLRCGCEIVPLFAHFPRGGDESDLSRFIEVIRALSLSVKKRLKVFVYRHEPNLMAFNKVAPKYTCILCRRQMYRVANKLAEKVGAKAVVTGENLAQVASQTLDNLSVMDSASDLPIIRPLIGMDKVDIIRVAKRIGTYEKSCARVRTGCLPQGGCWARPKKPVTKAKQEVVSEIEKRLDLERLLAESVGSLREISEFVYRRTNL